MIDNYLFKEKLSLLHCISAYLISNDQIFIAGQFEFDFNSFVPAINWIISPKVGLIYFS